MVALRLQLDRKVEAAAVAVEGVLEEMLPVLRQAQEGTQIYKVLPTAIHWVAEGVVVARLA